MATDESNDMLKNMDWKTLEKTGTNTMNTTVPITKKRLPKKMREVPEYYFIPRLSWPKTLSIYGTCILAGFGAAMLGDIWIQKKIKEDGGILFEIK